MGTWTKDDAVRQENAKYEINQILNLSANSIAYYLNNEEPIKVKIGITKNVAVSNRKFVVDNDFVGWVYTVVEDCWWSTVVKEGIEYINVHKPYTLDHFNRYDVREDDLTLPEKYHIGDNLLLNNTQIEPIQEFESNTVYTQPTVFNNLKVKVRAVERVYNDSKCTLKYIVEEEAENPNKKSRKFRVSEDNLEPIVDFGLDEESELD